MKERNSQWSAVDWKNAYEDEIKKATHFVRFETKASTLKVFEKLALKFPDINPFLFMQANSPSRRDWFRKTKTGWSKMKYPFPNMLGSQSAIDHYNKFIRQGIKVAVPRRDAITNAVAHSVTNLKKCRIPEDDYEGIWDLYIMENVSPYYIVMRKDMRQWISSEMRKGEITMEEKKVLDNTEKMLYGYSGLNIELKKIMKGK